MNVTHEMIKAALESQAVDDEGQFPTMLDLLDFSGQNKANTVMRAALEAAFAPLLDKIDALESELNMAAEDMYCSADPKTRELAVLNFKKRLSKSTFPPMETLSQQRDYEHTLYMANACHNS